MNNYATRTESRKSKKAKKRRAAADEEYDGNGGQYSLDLMDSPILQQQAELVGYADLISDERKNNTGIPDQMKVNYENHSGFSLDDVRVHYNSDKPAQLQAHAYAQGSEIHLASGQEKHLGHELWHVVQQKQGRVKATSYAFGKLVNDDPLLEKEADNLPTSQFHVSRSVQVSTEVLQLHTTVQGNGKRVGVKIDLLSDDDLEKVIEQLEGGRDHGFVIALDGETAVNLLARTREKLARRLSVTQRFNVRGRAVDAQGIIFLERFDDELLDVIASFDDILYAVFQDDSIQEARAVLPAFDEWRTIMDLNVPGLGKVLFIGEPALAERGPRDHAADPAANAQVLHAPNAQVVSRIPPITGPCRRGDEAVSRNAAMGNLSAFNYARAVEFEGAVDGTWEWLHMVGSSIGGANVLGNLVAGTYDSNTLMIPLEQAIVEFSNDPRVNAQHPLEVVAEATLWTNPQGVITWVAERIQLTAIHDGAVKFQLQSFPALASSAVTKLEYDFYSYIFRKMADN